MIDTYFYKLEAVNILIYLGLVFSPGEIVVIYFFLQGMMVFPIDFLTI